MEHFRTAIFITICLIVTASAIQKDHCLEYKLGNCIKCDEESNLAQGRCMENEVDCMTTQKINSENIKIENYPANGTYISPKNITQSTITLSSLAYNSNHQPFRSLPLQNCLANPFFLKCDHFVRSGQYSHFISRTTSPWQSVSIQQTNNINVYRIIYLGAGGGIMLCIIEIDKNSQSIKLTSLVTIAANQIVEHCLDYSSSQKCEKCSEGFHLQQNRCFRNIEGCVSYYHQLCLECYGWSLLIQNRCLMDCPSQCDPSHATFYGNFLLQKKQ